MPQYWQSFPEIQDHYFAFQAGKTHDPPIRRPHFEVVGNRGVLEKLEVRLRGGSRCACSAKTAKKATGDDNYYKSSRNNISFVGAKQFPSSRRHPRQYLNI
jgi:hypothetical protein